MPTINIEVNGHSVTSDGIFKLASGSNIYDRLKFTFDDSWNSLTKYASLSRDMKNFTRLALDANGECSIESTQISNEGDLYIGAYGEGSGSLKATTCMLRVAINAGSVKGIIPLTEEDVSTIMSELASFREEIGNSSGFVDCLESYYDNRANFSYLQKNTAMDNNYDPSKKVIDCSSYIGLCLMGVDYSKSPYAGGVYPPRKTGNWSIDVKGLGVRNAAGICEMLTDMGCRIPFTKSDTYTADMAKNDGIRNGDILFISRIGEGEDGNGRYMNITHVAAIWNIDHQYPIMEVTNGTGGSNPYPVKRGSWEVRGQDIVAVCRPKYNWNNYGLSVASSELKEDLNDLKNQIGSGSIVGGGLSNALKQAWKKSLEELVYVSANHPYTDALIALLGESDDPIDDPVIPPGTDEPDNPQPDEPSDDYEGKPDVYIENGYMFYNTGVDLTEPYYSSNNYSNNKPFTFNAVTNANTKGMFDYGNENVPSIFPQFEYFENTSITNLGVKDIENIAFSIPSINNGLPVFVINNSYVDASEETGITISKIYPRVKVKVVIGNIKQFVLGDDVLATLSGTPATTVNEHGNYTGFLNTSLGANFGGGVTSSHQLWSIGGLTANNTALASKPNGGLWIHGSLGRFYYSVPASQIEGDLTLDKLKEWMSGATCFTYKA